MCGAFVVLAALKALVCLRCLPSLFKKSRCLPCDGLLFVRIAMPRQPCTNRTSEVDHLRCELTIQIALPATSPFSVPMSQVSKWSRFLRLVLKGIPGVRDFGCLWAPPASALRRTQHCRLGLLSELPRPRFSCAELSSTCCVGQDALRIPRILVGRLCVGARVLRVTPLSAMVARAVDLAFSVGLALAVGRSPRVSLHDSFLFPEAVPHAIRRTL